VARVLAGIGWREEHLRTPVGFRAFIR
jgi:hypothetical protein